MKKCLKKSWFRILRKAREPCNSNKLFFKTIRWCICWPKEISKNFLWDWGYNHDQAYAEGIMCDTLIPVCIRTQHIFYNNLILLSLQISACLVSNLVRSQIPTRIPTGPPQNVHLKFFLGTFQPIPRRFFFCRRKKQNLIFFFRIS